jgi:hypothetical protein
MLACMIANVATGGLAVRSLLIAGLACIALALVPAARAATVSIDFESGPAIGTAITDDYKASAFTFWQRSDPGYRPYRRLAGVPTHSGTVAADIATHCFEEIDDAQACEFPLPGTFANVTRTPTAITLFAGLFEDAGTTVTATLTAYRADSSVAATTSAPIGVGITTPMTVTSAAPDIVRWSLSANVNGQLGFDDVTYNIPDNLVPEIGIRAPVDTVPVLQGSHTDVPISVTRVNGSDGPLHFAVSGLPNGVTGSVIPDPLSGTQSDATLRLTATDNATTTFLQNATLTADPQGDANVAPAPRSAQFTVRVAAAYGLRSPDTSSMHLPQCAPADRRFSLDRDRSFNSTATLSLENVPAGVSAQIVEGSTVAPGGGFNVERTLRVSRGTASLPDGSAITIRARAPGFPDKTLAVPIDNADPQATLGGTTVARAARRMNPGTTVRLDGNGFCPGTRVTVGNFLATADTTVADDRKSLTFVTPRNGTTGRVIVNPPNGAFAYQTPTDLTVNSFRGEDGFAFPNFHFGSLSISELTEAFGADDLFIQVNLCWPWSTCYVPTGILDPIAAIEWGTYNLVLRGGDGHCYGMNRAIQELLAGKTSYNRWAYGVHAPFDLPDASGPKNGLESYLDSRQALQLSSEALIARFDRDPHLGNQLDRIRTELEHGRYPGVVMKTGTVAGHEITAYDMERQPDGSTKIFGYDNNRPLTNSELNSPSRHLSAETQDSVITVNPAGDHWSFTSPSGSVWSGGGDDGKLYAVTLGDIPDNPSLPGLSDLPIIVTDIIASVDGAAQSGPAPEGGSVEPLTDQGPGTPGTAEVVSAPKGAGALAHTVEGVHNGTYSQLLVGGGFVGGVKDVATGKGVTDELSGSPKAGALTFAGERDRALDVNLAVDHGDVHRAASVSTRASKGGSDAIVLGKGASLTYTHKGATIRASFTLTSVQRNGGPMTFSSGPITVRRGERVKLTPMSWRSLDRVRFSSNKGPSKVLRNRAVFGATFSVGTPKLAKGRASVATSIRRLPAQTAGGIVLRLLRGHRTVAHKAIAITSPRRGRHTYNWKLPKSLKRGTYRLVANMTLAGGARNPGRRAATKAAQVRVG